MNFGQDKSIRDLKKKWCKIVLCKKKDRLEAWQAGCKLGWRKQLLLLSSRGDTAFSWAFTGHRKERPGTISRSSQVWTEMGKGQVVFQRDRRDGAFTTSKRSMEEKGIKTSVHYPVLWVHLSCFLPACLLELLFCSFSAPGFHLVVSDKILGDCIKNNIYIFF